MRRVVQAHTALAFICQGTQLVLQPREGLSPGCIHDSNSTPSTSSHCGLEGCVTSGSGVRSASWIYPALKPPTPNSFNMNARGLSFSFLHVPTLFTPSFRGKGVSGIKWDMQKKNQDESNVAKRMGNERNLAALFISKRLKARVHTNPSNQPRALISLPLRLVSVVGTPRGFLSFTFRNFPRGFTPFTSFPL